MVYCLLTVLQPPRRGSLLRRHVAALLALLGEQLEVPGVRARGLFGVGLELGVDGLGLGLALALGLGLGLQLRLGLALRNLFMRLCLLDELNLSDQG